MRKDEITELVQIPGFSVEEMSFFERKGKTPEVRIRLTRDKPWYCCAGCGQYYLTYYDRQPFDVRNLPYGNSLTSTNIKFVVYQEPPKTNVIIH